MFPDHLLQRAHEHRDEAIDVAGVVTAGGLQDHQRSWKINEGKKGRKVNATRKKKKVSKRTFFLQGRLADIQLLLILNT